MLALELGPPHANSDALNDEAAFELGDGADDDLSLAKMPSASIFIDLQLRR